MIRANGGTCVGYKVDISKKEEVYKAADAIRRDVGDVSVFMCLKWFCFFFFAFSFPVYERNIGQQSNNQFFLFHLQ